MPHKWDWNDLNVVIAVAEAGSANAAATRLGVNHATVLRRIERFERTAGVTLFRRSPLGYQVEPGALPIIEALQKVGEAVDTAGRVVAGEGEHVSGPVRITTTDSIAYAIMPRLLKAFQKAHPAISVTLITTNVRLDLGRMDADLSIRPGQSMPEGVVSQKAATMKLRVYGAASNIARLAAGDAPQWLCVSELLSRSPAFVWQARLPAESIVFRADSFVTLAAMAREGSGLAMLPSFLADGLTVSPLHDQMFEVGIWVGAHPDLLETPRIALCRRWFAEALAADPAFAD